MKKSLQSLLAGLVVSQLAGSMMAQTVVTGPSATQSPYVLPLVPGFTVTSLLNAGTAVGNYTMSGLPDGLGAFDNNDGTFTLLMNHEFGSGSTGAVHAYGSAGAYVSKWIINKSTLNVVSGADLTQNVYLWNAASSTYSMYNASNTSTLAGFGRFCSADLAAPTAFFNPLTGKGTTARMLLNGEEIGDNGRMLAHIASGTEAGNTYELPYLGKFSCENQVANPRPSDKTIVAGFDDTTPGQVYIYVGNKMSAGNEITKAGLVGGTLYGVAVQGMLNESNGTFAGPNTTFSLIPLGSNIQAITGTSLQALSVNLGVTQFLRPEDGAWDPSSPRDLYFNTTNAFNSPSRVWRLRFNDIENPQLGGTITAVLDGTEGQQMLDNMTIDNSGHIYLNEDVGNNAFLGRVLVYDIASDVLTPVLQHDVSRFTTSGANFLTQDEEASGILDVQSILGPGKLLFVSQAHYSVPSPVVEGGQLLMLNSALSTLANPEVNVQGNGNNIASGTAVASSTNNTNFGMVNVNTGLSKTFVIQNTGTGTLVVSDVFRSGANAGDFSLVNPPAFPWSIAPGASQTITVSFNSPVAGTRSATISLMNNDFDEALYSYAIQATAASVEINLLGNSANIADGSNTTSSSNNTDYGMVMGGVPLVKNFDVQNTGNGTLTVTGINVTGTNASDFTVLNAPAFPWTLSGSSSQTFALQFMPSALGTRTAVVNIMSNDADEATYDYKVQGEGVVNTGIESAIATGGFVNLFPNPAKDEAILSVRMDQDNQVIVKIYDLLGKQVGGMEKDLSAGQNQISIATSELKSGVYFVQIEAGAKSEKIKMLVKH